MQTPSADFLSKEIEEPFPPDVLLFDAFLGLTASIITEMTCKDPVLSRLYSALQAAFCGGDDFRAYVQRAFELSISHGCITRGDRVVVPVSARAQAMMLVHAG